MKSFPDAKLGMSLHNPFPVTLFQLLKEWREGKQLWKKEKRSERNAQALRSSVKTASSPQTGRSLWWGQWLTLFFLTRESAIPDIETDLCTPGREILCLNWLNYNPCPFKYRVVSLKICNSNSLTKPTKHFDLQQDLWAIFSILFCDLNWETDHIWHTFPYKFDAACLIDTFLAFYKMVNGLLTFPPSKDCGKIH